MENTSPIEKKLNLNVPPEKAFRHFTENIHLWWPLKTHSLSQEAARTVVFEDREGGRVYEIDAGGKEREWGEIKTYAPFSQLVFSWVLEKPDRATEVEVRFDEDGGNSCVMTLIHRGWQTHPEGAKWRGNYNKGWIGVLKEYETALL